MQFYELEACLAIANTQNFTRACEAVHLSPSALSRLVSRVEDELGIKIFLRDTRSVTVTSEGKEFIEFARSTLANKNNLIEKFNSKDDKLSGQLKIFASVTACYSILPPLVELLSEKYPLLKLSVETGDPADAYLAIKEGRADLAVDAPTDEKILNAEFFLVQSSPLVFVASNTSSFASYLQQKDDKNLFSIISKMPMILSKSGLSRNRFDKCCKDNGIKPNISAECGGHEGVLALTRLGLGIGLVPLIVLENSPFKNNLISVSVEKNIGSYDIGFILQKSEKMQQRLHDKLVELIQTLC